MPKYNTTLDRDLTIHCLIRNEENWIWFALQAMAPFCRRIMLWDTGSIDTTVAIIKEMQSPHILFQQCGPVSPAKHTALRNHMIAQTRTEWFAVVDGDEIWPPALWSEIAYRIEDPKAGILVLPFIYPFPRLGYFGTGEDDFFIAGLSGPRSAKVFRNCNGIHWSGDYFDTRLCYEDGTIATRGSLPNMRVLDSCVWHMTMLERSRQDDATMGRHGKLRFTGPPSKADFVPIKSWSEVPKVFFHKRPNNVKNPFLIQNRIYRDMAVLPHPCLENS